MDEARFERTAEQTLNALVDAIGGLELDDVDADLDSGVLTVAFADGGRFVINSHRAARQIWMAAGADAWHFDWDGREWRSTKGGEELWGLVRARVGAKLGRDIALSAGR